MVILILKDFIRSLALFFGPMFFFLQLLLQGVSNLELEQPHPNHAINSYRRLREWTLPSVTLGIWLTAVIMLLILLDSSLSYFEKKTYIEFLENIYIYFLMMSFVNMCFFICESITEEELEDN